LSAALEIRPQDLKIVQDIVKRVLPEGTKVFVFGSRAQGVTKRASDLDLAIEADTPLTFKESAILADAFEESDLPYKVDVVDLKTVGAAFSSHVRENMVPLPEREN
jgi:predicted nucleotidyltransferase